MSSSLSQPSSFGADRPRALATVHVESERAVAEVQAAMILARRFPRNVIEAQDRILNACTRPGLAEGALYSYSRGGTEITGPSIRLAEVMAQNWGNMQFGIRELEQRDGESTVEAFAWDIESNVKQTKTFQVPHIRYSKANGNTPLSDPRDIYELIANQGARRVRACILGIIPGDVTEAAQAQCETTLKATAEVTPESIAKVLTFFESFGVTREQIEALIQRRIDTMQPAQMVRLRKIAASLKDGMSKPGDWFKGPAKPEGFGKDSPPPAGDPKDEVLGGSSSVADVAEARPAPAPASEGKTPARRTAKPKVEARPEPDQIPFGLEGGPETPAQELRRKVQESGVNVERFNARLGENMWPPLSAIADSEALEALECIEGLIKEARTS